MKHTLFLALSFFCFFTAPAQLCEADTIFRKVKEVKEIRAGIAGFPFQRTLRISRESLKTNFSIVLEDSSYKVVGGLLTYLCGEGCTLCLPVFGNRIDTEELDFFKELKENEFLSFDELVVEKDKKRFKIPSFFVAVTE